MNKQSNVYTIIYIIVLVVVVGAALAFTATSLKDRQQANADADKMKQILAAVHVVPANGEVKADFEKYITDQFVVNEAGEKVEGTAFDVDVAVQSKEADTAKRLLPVYVCNAGENGTKYIFPVYGAGLWGPIWGYVAVDSDGSTIYGAYFAHSSETPGLGAEIEKSAFTEQFNGKVLFKDDKMLPVAVVKKGQEPSGNEDYVNGISGGTITSKGVGAMLSNCLQPYEAYLKTLRK